MALNLEILEILEDIDPTTRAVRLRARMRELKPRTHLVNLKNLDAEQLNIIQRNIGGVLSVPAREMLMDGRFMLSIAASDEEFFVLRAPEKIAVSKTVDFVPSDINKPNDHKKVG
jgi:hypothetical protein